MVAYMLKRILRRIHHYLLSLLPSDEEKQFIEVNSAFWKPYWSSPPAQKEIKHVLIEEIELLSNTIKRRDRKVE